MEDEGGEMQEMNRTCPVAFAQIDKKQPEILAPHLFTLSLSLSPRLL